MRLNYHLLTVNSGFIQIFLIGIIDSLKRSTDSSSQKLKYTAKNNHLNENIINVILKEIYIYIYICTRLLKTVRNYVKLRRETISHLSFHTEAIW